MGKGKKERARRRVGTWNQATHGRIWWKAASKPRRRSRVRQGPLHFCSTVGRRNSAIRASLNSCALTRHGFEKRCLFLHARGSSAAVAHANHHHASQTRGSAARQPAGRGGSGPAMTSKGAPPAQLLTATPRAPGCRQRSAGDEMALLRYHAHFRSPAEIPKPLIIRHL